MKVADKAAGRGRVSDKFRWLDQVGADPNLTPLCFRVAYAIASLVNSNTGDAWPGQDLLATKCHVSDRTIRRAVELLEVGGHVEVTVGGGRGDTNRYRPLLKPAQTRTAASTFRGNNVDIGVQDISEKPGHSCPETRTRTSGEGGHRCPTIPLIEPIKETIERKSLTMITNVASDFEQFWSVFPKKVGKLKAAQLHAKIIKARTANADELLAGAKRYAAERAGQDAQYTRHPSTWLNAGGWLDEPQIKANDSILAGLQSYCAER